MSKSFLSVQDWSPHFQNVNNSCWFRIQNIIDEFEAIVNEGSYFKI